MSNAPWLWPGSTVLRVIDGDSIVGHVEKTVTIDCGFHVMLTQKIEADQKMRLNRINAVKGTTTDGLLATAYLTTLVMGVGLVTLETTKAYKYGDEWMVEITLADGTNVSDKMVSTGHAFYWNGVGPRPGG